MKRILIIGDVHNNVDRVSLLLDRVSFDEVYCLGDWFHDFHDSPGKNRRTAVWLKEHPEIKSVLGNHDACHRWPGLACARCPGWTPEKHRAISEVMSKDDWDRFALHLEPDGFVLSHAGVHPQFYHPVEGMSMRHLEELERQALINAGTGQYHPLLSSGEDRGFRFQGIGGITWMDWGMLIPIPSVNQIVGHTPASAVRTKHTASSKNWCLDTGLKSYGVIQDGDVHIRPWPSRMTARDPAGSVARRYKRSNA